MFYKSFIFTNANDCGVIYGFGCFFRFSVGGGGGGGGGAPFIVPSAPKLSSKINNRLDPLNSLFSKNSMKQIFFNVKY